jgi:hypothetical protein
MVAYVLAADPRYATVLKAADSTVQILELDEVESRTICCLNSGLESASLVRYIAGSARNARPRASGSPRKSMNRLPLPLPLPKLGIRRYTWSLADVDHPPSS